MVKKMDFGFNRLRGAPALLLNVQELEKIA